MKKVFIMSMVFFIAFISCKNEKERMLKEMGDKYIKTLKDDIFKKNGTVNVLEFIPISYETKNEIYLDSACLNVNLDNIKYCSMLLRDQKELCKVKLDRLKLYKELFGLEDYVTQSESDEFDNEMTKANMYLDSLNYYLKQDSLIKSRISKRKNPGLAYSFRAYLKAIFKYNNSDKINNYADTINLFYDKDLNLIPFDPVKRNYIVPAPSDL